jgi:hypothetical protein
VHIAAFTLTLLAILYRPLVIDAFDSDFLRAQGRWNAPVVLNLAAGSIIKPTDIRVPSTWKPATRLSTTSINGALLLVGGIAAFTLTLLAILYRPLVIDAFDSDFLNSTCSRSTLEPRSEISVTPSASEPR